MPPATLRFVDGRRYRVVVDGELGPRYASAFDGMTVVAHAGKTEIAGWVRDQSQLQGLLDRIGSLGLTLVSVVSDEVPDPVAPADR